MASIIGLGSGTGVPGGGKLPPNETMTQTRNIAPDGTTKTRPRIKNTRTDPLRNNPVTSPLKGADSGAFGVDAYRFGGFKNTDGDPLVNPRVLSDYVDDEQAANIWLTTDSGTDLISAYGRFFLQSVSESEHEKFQIVETFTQFYVFFYGKRPPVFRYTGVLLNDKNFRWSNDFRYVYENFLRGTQATSLNSTCLLQYDDKQVTGLILSMSMEQTAADPKAVPFSIDVLVLEYNLDGAFSKDIGELLATKQKELQDLKAQIERELAAVNKNVKTEDRLAAGQALSNLGPKSAVLRAEESFLNASPPSLKVPSTPSVGIGIA